MSKKKLQEKKSIWPNKIPTKIKMSDLRQHFLSEETKAVEVFVTKFTGDVNSIINTSEELKKKRSYTFLSYHLFVRDSENILACFFCTF